MVGNHMEAFGAIPLPNTGLENKEAAADSGGCMHMHDGKVPFRLEGHF